MKTFKELPSWFEIRITWSKLSNWRAHSNRDNVGHRCFSSCGRASPARWWLAAPPPASVSTRTYGRRGGRWGDRWLSRIDRHQTSWSTPDRTSHIHAPRLNSGIRNPGSFPTSRNRRGSHRYGWLYARRSACAPMRAGGGNPSRGHGWSICPWTLINRWHFSHCRGRVKLHLRWWRHVLHGW
jgi:hypothetical protein